MMATLGAPGLETAPQTEGLCIATAALGDLLQNLDRTVRHSRLIGIPFAMPYQETLLGDRKPYLMRLVDLAAVIPGIFGEGVAGGVEAGETIAETAVAIEIWTSEIEEITTEMSVAESVIVEIGEIVTGTALEDVDLHLVADHLPGGISGMREIYEMPP